MDNYLVPPYITLGQLVRYFKSNDNNAIQVCLYNNDWENFDELSIGSGLLDILGDWYVTEMGIEESILSDERDFDKNVLRVVIRKGD